MKLIIEVDEIEVVCKYLQHALDSGQVKITIELPLDEDTVKAMLKKSHDMPLQIVWPEPRVTDQIEN